MSHTLISQSTKTRKKLSQKYKNKFLAAKISHPFSATINFALDRTRVRLSAFWREKESFLALHEKLAFYNINTKSSDKKENNQ